MLYSLILSFLRSYASDAKIKKLIIIYSPSKLSFFSIYPLEYSLSRQFATSFEKITFAGLAGLTRCSLPVGGERQREARNNYTFHLIRFFIHNATYSLWTFIHHVVFFNVVKMLKIIGDNIRYYRKKAGLSQEKLAELTGLHRTYIGSVERGERNISALNIAKIAYALKLEPHVLLKEKHET